jgi:putative ABC transport system ATP-binding protein
MSSPIIELDNVVKVYPLPSGDVTALSGVTLTIDEGEFIAIMGPSGSGKSTLLNQIGCLDRPTSGDLTLAGKNTREMDDRELTDLRLSSIGYVFQKFNLIPLLTAYENVEYPYIMKHRKNDDTGRVRDLLAQVGIDESLSAHKPNELSGSQQQRIAIARALVNDPAILLCDEPTGNLDSQTSTQIMEILADLHGRGRTIVMVTHESGIAAYAERIIVIRDGRVA